MNRVEGPAEYSDIHLAGLLLNSSLRQLVDQPFVFAFSNYYQP